MSYTIGTIQTTQKRLIKHIGHIFTLVDLTKGHEERINEIRELIKWILLEHNGIEWSFRYEWETPEVKLFRFELFVVVNQFNFSIVFYEDRIMVNNRTFGIMCFYSNDEITTTIQDQLAHITLELL